MSENFYRVLVVSTGQVVADKVRIAQDFKSRSVGLLNKTGLKEGEGLLIKPCSSIHTFFMKFPIDAVFLSRRFKVLKTYSNLAPWRLAGCPFGAHMVLELGSGVLKGLRLKMEEALRLEKVA